MWSLVFLKEQSSAPPYSINDIAHHLNSKIRLFADDCHIYKEIENSRDQELLQADLNQLHKWSIEWQMAFNVSKCYSMTVTIKKRKKNHVYAMGGEALTPTVSTPYLGLTLQCDLKWSSHISIITTKAQKILGMLRRNLNKAPCHVKAKSFTTLARPKLEYCSSIWSPWQAGEKNKLERLQRSGARNGKAI